MRHIILITTGGTIEKTYDERTGTLDNRGTILPRMLRRLRLEGVTLSCRELLNKDSLYMTEDDRGMICGSVRAALAEKPGGVVILHGTDTLTVTGERLKADIQNPGAPIVLTGAMRPYEMKRSDALQNLTEAIFATGVLQPGIYCVAHGRALAFPGVVKDKAAGTFVKA